VVKIWDLTCNGERRSFANYKFRGESL